MANSIQTRPYGSVTWLERLHMVFVFLPLPVVSIYRLLSSFFVQHEKHKTWRRVLADFSFRYSSSSLRVNQIQSLLGSDLDVYTKWAKRQKVEKLVEELDKDSSLMWLSKKSTEKVILYIHGGCYCLPIQDFAADYWKKAVDSINQDFPSAQVGLVALAYPLIPNGNFPSQLKPIILAIQHLLSQGTKPENIHIAGESAGGGLVLQLLSHLLHPVPDSSVPKLTLPEGTKLGSMCIMSPIVSLNTKAASHRENTDKDVLPDWSWGELFEYVLPFLRTSEDAAPYAEALNTPEGWFSGAEGVVGRVWMSVGEHECMRDDVQAVMKKIPSQQPGFLTTFIEPSGVHNSQYLDCMAGEANELHVKIAEWVREGLQL
ncbi:alpha/beta hydrolase fold protein [Coprinopsis cinerea AmutBmut pab1-1]|nr:alpha/beta hydrolase fold protein [Coprinopsis cinerea AmutBmut pab1-1]